jgi:hypothetical protein
MAEIKNAGDEFRDTNGKIPIPPFPGLFSDSKESPAQIIKDEDDLNKELKKIFEDDSLFKKTVSIVGRVVTDINIARRFLNEYGEYSAAKRQAKERGIELSGFTVYEEFAAMDDLEEDRLQRIMSNPRLNKSCNNDPKIAEELFVGGTVVEVINEVVKGFPSENH